MEDSLISFEVETLLILSGHLGSDLFGVKRGGTLEVPKMDGKAFLKE